MSVSTKTSIEAAIIRLAKMTVPQLQQRHAELFGEEGRTADRCCFHGRHVQYPRFLPSKGRFRGREFH
jgi:hypothetical protein